nr:MAG TPA: protein of unknown function (DUF1840) [Caudoviricetes sp.]
MSFTGSVTLSDSCVCKIGFAKRVFPLINLLSEIIIAWHR